MKSKNMGYLPFNEDRSIFEKRFEMINSLDIMGRAIVYDWENYFTPSEALGDKFSTLLEKYITSFELAVKNGLKGADFVINSDIVKQALTKNAKANSVFNEFDNILFPVGNPNAPMYVKTTSGHIFYAVNKVSKLPKTARGNIFDITTYPLKSEYKYSGDVILPSETTSVKKGTYPETKVSYREVDSFINKVKLTRLIDKPKEVITGATGGNFEFKIGFAYSDGGLLDVSFILTYLTANQIVQVFKDTLTTIKWLESENNAVEIRGNVDGVKLDAYEKILADQLKSLNNISDIAQSGLINEKIEFQKKKDDYTKLITDKKAEIAEAIKNKKAEIAKMNNKVNAYNDTLKTKKAEVLRNLESQMGK